MTDVIEIVWLCLVLLAAILMILRFWRNLRRNNFVLSRQAKAYLAIRAVAVAMIVYAIVILVLAVLLAANTRYAPYAAAATALAGAAVQLNQEFRKMQKARGK